MKKLIVVVHYSLRDPLFYGNLFQYLCYYSKCKSNVNIILITHERKPFQFDSNDEKILFSQKLKKEYNIHWKPLVWKSYNNILFKITRKIYEAFLVFVFMFYYKIFHKYNHSISLGTSFGSFIFLISKLIGIKFFIYQYEPHSEYMLDSGIVGKNDLSYIILNYIERKMAIYSEYISTTTSYMIDRLKNEYKRDKNVYLIRSCVDDALFNFSEDAREHLRKKFNFTYSDKVILYAGKFGDLYYCDEIPAFLKHLKKLDPSWKIVIITPQEVNHIKSIFSRNGLEENDYILLANIYYPEIKDYYSLADIGLIAVPPGYSKKFTSSIKIGEYLCCGLPYIICKGIGEDDFIAEKYQVGVVLNYLTPDELEKNYHKINSLLNHPKEEIVKSCRSVGVNYRGLSHLNPQMYQIIEKYLNE